VITKPKARRDADARTSARPPRPGSARRSARKTIAARRAVAANPDGTAPAYAGLHGLTTAIMVVSAEARIAYLNPAAAALFGGHREAIAAARPGLDASRLLGEHLDRLDPGPLRALLADPDRLPRAAEVLLGGLVLQVAASTAQDGDRILEWTDVTESRARDARQRDDTSQVTALQAAQSIIYFDLAGTIVDVNDNFLCAVGYRRDELVGQNRSIIVDAAEARGDSYHQGWDRVIASTGFSGQARRLGKGGRELWFQATYVPLRDASGKPYRVAVYATDITAQKHALRDVTAVVGCLANGDLTAEMTGSYDGDFAALRDSVNQSIRSLRSMVGEIRDTVATITSAAGQIASGNASLSTRTQEQSSALEETAAGIEEMTATVKQNAGNAKAANQLAAGARAAAEHGGQVVQAAVTAMSAITESSTKVADIVGVIEQIAFQTNMLALNAAVEAARAGDQGRGFAVVAAEVRNLAQRSAVAAKEIQSLIQDSADKVGQGAKLVYQSGETLRDIVSSVKRVSDIIGEITTASAEQATGIEQINGAVVQIDHGTQENAALVEEASSAASAMTEQAERLTKLVSAFRVTASARFAPAGHPAARARP